MKKCLLVFMAAICLFTPMVKVTYCTTWFSGDIEFFYGNRAFEYSFSKNKPSNLFYKNAKDKQLNRFGTEEQRKDLLKHLLEIGIDEEVAVNYLFPNLNKTIAKIERTINKQAKNAKIKTNTATEQVFFVQNEEEGTKVDKRKLYLNICNNLLQNKSLNFKIPTTKITPDVLAVDLKKFTNLRADFSTNISSSTYDRKHNIKNALQSLNLVEIAPGQTFSFNKTVGRRTAENGYRTSKIIVDNEFVDGLGGGVCQVSTTLYNCALLAGLDIVEANKHSRQVGYVKYGFDAMVNYGSSDLRFTNNTNQKITIVTNFSSTQARIRMFGEDMGDVRYKLVNKIENVVEPQTETRVDVKQEYANKVCFEDESFFLKPAIRGMDVTSYREKLVDGKIESVQKLRLDKFKAQNAVKVFGANPRPGKQNSLEELISSSGWTNEEDYDYDWLVV